MVAAFKQEVVHIPTVDFQTSVPLVVHKTLLSLTIVSRTWDYACVYLPTGSYLRSLVYTIVLIVQDTNC